MSVSDPDVRVEPERIDDRDLSVTWFSGTGAGGQHRNKTQNSCRLKHVPTGIVTTAQTRSRDNSYRLAFADLEKKLNELKGAQTRGMIATMKKKQVGSGMRGDKVRTYRFRDDTVKDHRTDKEATCASVMSGRFDKLW